MTMEKQPHLDHVKTIGDFLREEREKRNIDLKTIAIRTKINFTILKELESNNYHKIPDKTYIRGFVKSYAKELGADVNEVLEYLDRTYTKKDKRAPVSSNNPLPTPKLSAAPVQPKKAVTTPEKKIQKNNPPKKEPGKLFSFYSEYKKEMLFLTVAIIFLSVVVSFITGKSAPKKVIVKADIITSQVKPATTPIAVLEKEETIPASMEPEKTLSNIPKPDPKIETHSKVVLTDTAKILKVEPAKSTETVKPMEETPVEPIEKEKKEDDASKKIAFRKIAVPIYSLNSSAPEINDR